MFRPSEQSICIRLRTREAGSHIFMQVARVFIACKYSNFQGKSCCKYNIREVTPNQAPLKIREVRFFKGHAQMDVNLPWERIFPTLSVILIILPIIKVFQSKNWNFFRMPETHAIFGVQTFTAWQDRKMWQYSLSVQFSSLAIIENPPFFQLQLTFFLEEGGFILDVISLGVLLLHIVRNGAKEGTGASWRGILLSTTFLQTQEFSFSLIPGSQILYLHGVSANFSQYCIARWLF